VARHLLPALAAVDGIEVVEWRLLGRGADVGLGLATFPPRRALLPIVQVLYDVIPLVDPDPRFADARRLWRSRSSSWQRVARFVAISAWSASTAAEQLGLDPASIDVVHLAPGPQFVPDGPAVERKRPYLLVATTWGPHKGVEVAMAAVDRLVDAGHDVELVVAGDQLPYGQARLEEARAAAAHPDRVDLVGWVPDLAALYRGAAVVVVPSRAEGFGLPAVEAMACDAPVVASAGTGLAEAVGDGGVLVPPGDAAALAGAVADLLDDATARADLVARGRARVAGMSWTAVAEAYASVLRASAST